MRKFLVIKNIINSCMHDIRNTVPTELGNCDASGLYLCNYLQYQSQGGRCSFGSNQKCGSRHVKGPGLIGGGCDIVGMGGNLFLRSAIGTDHAIMIIILECTRKLIEYPYSLLLTGCYENL